MNQHKTQEPDWPPRSILCVGLIVLRKDCILLVRQAAGTSLAGQWSIPWGLVETGERPEKAALRETEEESGITAALRGLLGVQNLKWQSATALIYLAEHISGLPTPDGQETTAAGYFTIAQLDSLAEPIEPWCNWLVRRVLDGHYTLIVSTDDNPYRPQLAFL